MVAEIVGTTTNDWLTVKKLLFLTLAVPDRKLLSIRHYVTQKQVPNEYDLFAIKLWKELTGVQLIIPPEKLHDPNWKRGGPPGWHLAEVRDKFNAERAARIQKRRQLEEEQKKAKQSKEGEVSNE